MKILIFILCLLAGLIFLNAGLDKFFHYMPVPELEPELQKADQAIATVKWLLPLVGFVEVVGGILLIIPKTRILATLILFPVLVGILVHTLSYSPAYVLIPFLIFVLFVNLWWEKRNKIRNLIFD